MKTIILITLIIALMSPSSLLAYDINCMKKDDGKFDDCKVLFDGDIISVDYKSKKEADFNINPKKIKAITSGEYARRRVAEAIGWTIALTPIALFALMSKKKRDQIGVEYTDEDGKPRATMFELKKKYSMGFKNDLKAISGKEIVEAPQEKKAK